MDPAIRGPLETIFSRLNFKPLVLFTFGEMSSNVRDYFVNLVADYGAEHLDTSTATTSLEAVRGG